MRAAVRWISVDVEADGPAPGLYSMVSFGAVAVEPELSRCFRAQVRPISDRWDPDALQISGVSRAEHEAFSDPAETMAEFEDWLGTVARKVVFVADNPGFDFAYINYYFHRFLGRNPFGWSSRSIGDLYSGLAKNRGEAWKRLRKTAHTHDPLDDARGNAEALIALHAKGLKVPGLPTRANRGKAEG